ncbi:hypothetical protein [Rubellimicrobium arenae]|uniref:hypothetical protein n=1 Tax=Rubellimicrobium arenae TaxID=2817372 RepID=UPI001B314CF0|nr:hypothetical protein [Rubellimicrobium arenae]
MILVIGNLRTWEREGRPVPRIEGFRFTSFAQLEAALSESPAPDVVLSALMGESFDALDVARVLNRCGFAGRYRALTNALPNLDAIRQEVHEIAPFLDFDLYIIRRAASAG